MKNLTPSLVNGSRGVIVRFETHHELAMPVVAFANGAEVLMDPQTWESTKFLLHID